MKKFFIFFCFLLCLGLFAACSSPLPPAGDKSSCMQIEPARLTKEEEQLLQLVDGGRNTHLFDFCVDESAQSVQISVYRLEDGQWQSFGGGGSFALEESQGRLALASDRFPIFALSLRGTVQDSGGIGYFRYITSAEKAKDFETMRISTSYLSSLEEIRYEEEIPLAVQILSSGGSPASCDVSYFYIPERLYGREHVYAVTILFSQQPLE